MPDGTLINREDGKEYSYLFWEGKSDVVYDMTHGYVVKGADTAAFLQATLSRMGLIPREYNEFIVFWLPRMEKNPFNLITFRPNVTRIMQSFPFPQSRTAYCACSWLTGRWMNGLR